MTKPDNRKKTTINERLYDCAEKLQDLADVLRACGDGKVARNEIGIKYGCRPQRIQWEIRHGFQCLIREKLGHQLTKNDLITCLLALEPPSDRILKDIFEINKHTLITFPEYDAEQAYDVFFHALNNNEQTVLHLYYVEKKHTPEIAKMLNMSKSRICQVKNDILHKLRNPSIFAEIWPDQKMTEIRTKEKTLRIKINNSIQNAAKLKTDEETARYRKTLRKLKQEISLEEEKLNVQDKHKNLGHITYIDDLKHEFSARTYNAVKNAGYTTIEDIVHDFPSKLKLINSTTNYHDAKRKNRKPSIPNLGKKSANELANWMTCHNYY